MPSVVDSDTDLTNSFWTIRIRNRIFFQIRIRFFDIKYFVQFTMVKFKLVLDCLQFQVFRILIH
jgi:hypothetical protein